MKNTRHILDELRDVVSDSNEEITEDGLRESVSILADDMTLKPSEIADVLDAVPIARKNRELRLSWFSLKWRSDVLR